jgi:exopolysaccharide production protein ExoQ
MPPFLALTLGLLFIAWALWRDHKNDPYPTGLWLPTLWMMRCGSRGIDFWLSGEGGARWDPIFIAVLILAGCVTLARRPINWSNVLSVNSALFFFYAFLVTSTIWSQSTENPVIKLLRPVGDLIMALIITSERDPFGSIAKMFQRTAMVLIPLSVVLIKYYPWLGKVQDKHWGEDLWVGVTTHKNPLGQLCLVSVLGLLWWMKEQRERGVPLLRQRTALVYVVLTIYLLNAGGTSRSSTAILCALVALSLHTILGWNEAKVKAQVRLIIGGSITIAVVAGVLSIMGTSLQAVVAEASGKDATLSDRTYLWRDVIRIGSEDPILGKGYGGFWIKSVYDKLSPQVDNAPAEAHNGYLETFANLGIIGLALLIGAIVQAIRNALSLVSFDFEYGRMRLMLLITVGVMNYAEATFPRGNHLWWFGFLVAALFTRSSVFWPEDMELSTSEAQPAALEMQWK